MACSLLELGLDGFDFTFSILFREFLDVINEMVSSHDGRLAVNGKLDWCY